MIDITNEEFILIRKYILDNYGINLTSEKKSMLYSRLRTILEEEGFNNFSEYYKYLVADKTGAASKVFINKMSTNHTFFMRETSHFDYFSDIVLPYIETSSPTKDVRIWCAGCSSGQESYTLQIIMNEFFGDNPPWNTQLLATDISTTVLSKAIDGIYKKDDIKNISTKWRSYFNPISNNTVKVCDKIRDKIIYRKFNLMEKTFPFKKKFQVIFCRNVMIYFDDTVKTNLIKKFYNVSEKGAYLFIGHAETLSNIDTEYKYIMPAVYRKI